MSKLVSFRSAYNAHCTFMQFYPVKNENFYAEEGVGGGGVIKCSLTFKVGYLIKRGACFETGKNFDMAFDFEIKNVISC